MAKRKLNNNLYYTAIIIALILGMAIAFYGYFNYRAKIDLFKLQEEKEQEKIIQEETVKSEQERKREECILEAMSKSHDSWNKQCESRSLERDCQLPQTLWERSDEKQKIAKENCIKMYPAN